MTSYRYQDFAEKHFVITNISNSEAMIRCIFHEDGNASMQFNMESGLFICFSGKCGERGSIKTIEKHLGVRAGTDIISVADIRARLAALKKGPVRLDLPPLPESYLRRYNFPTDFWAKRGLSPSTVKQFDLGADPMGEFVTIPLRNTRGELIGFIRRSLDPDAELRYRYPKGFKRSINLFGSWLVQEDEDAHTVVLTEGSLDAISVWQAGFPAMAIYGSSMGAAQIRLLRRLGVSKVIMFFDNDDAGRKCNRTSIGWKEHRRKGKSTWEYRPELDLRRSFFVEKVVFDQVLGKNDPGDMSSLEIKQALKRTKWVR